MEKDEGMTCGGCARVKPREDVNEQGYCRRCCERYGRSEPSEVTPMPQSAL